MATPTHLQSISLPTQPHSLILRAEKELHRLRSCVSSSQTPQAMSAWLRELSDLCEYVEEIVRLPNNWDVLRLPRHRQLVEAELEESVTLLDLCGAARDGLAATKEKVRDLRSLLRRQGRPRAADVAAGGKAEAYAVALKKMIRAIKRECGRCGSESRGDSCSAPKPVAMLAEVRELVISLLQSAVGALLRQVAVRPSGSRWSLVSRALLYSRSTVSSGGNGNHEDGAGEDDELVFGSCCVKGVAVCKRMGS